MKKIIYLISLTFSGFLFFGYGCSGGDASVESRVVAEMDVVPTIESRAVPSAEAVAIPEQRKVIKTGRMGLRVDRIDKAQQQVNELVTANEGYFAEENSDQASGVTLTIRIPAGRFDAFISSLETDCGTVLYKNITARDMSEEYVDIETRLDNKRRYLERYRELLKRAASIEEILEVEHYIRGLEEEIESTEGRLRYLNNQLNYSTLTLTLSTERIAEPTRDRFGSRIVRALSAGWHGVVSLAVGALYLWPLIVIGILVGLIVRRQVKRKNKRKNEAKN